jgi:hypothetical protein
MPGLEGSPADASIGAAPAIVNVIAARPVVTGLPVASTVTCAANRVSLPTTSGGYSMNSSVRSLHTVTDCPGSSGSAP